MEELREKLMPFLSDRLCQITVSGPREKDGIYKIKIRPLLLKGELVFQKTAYKGTQVFHENLSGEELLEELLHEMQGNFRQLAAESLDGSLTVLVSKKGKVTAKYKENQKNAVKMRPELYHNRVKQYILKEGIPVPFLVDLGIQTREGAIVRAKYDKFKQINRYLEFVEDVLPVLKGEGAIHIIDFGCGKSYLTFALYYYLHELQKLDVMITGLDLKTDVIHNCNRLAQSYGYDRLQFVQGDIKNFTGSDQVDMVVTLHACDTATDYAIEKAVGWGAKVIFTVPCCQHEVNGQIQNKLLHPVLKYGLLKERLSAILTDAIRANLLEEAGYDTQVLEFIEMEHTPKNILIRAVRRQEKREDSGISELTAALGVETTLQKLFRKDQE
ncbi:methyltransferase [Firmicutes bacterium CAG:534]|nr:methyltransferase [Firmicutes bacterium CAG:534]